MTWYDTPTFKLFLEKNSHPVFYLCVFNSSQMTPRKEEDWLWHANISELISSLKVTKLCLLTFISRFLWGYFMRIFSLVILLNTRNLLKIYLIPGWDPNTHYLSMAQLAESVEYTDCLEINLAPGWDPNRHYLSMAHLAESVEYTD